MVEAMKSGMFDPAIKSITKLGGFTDATKRMQGVMVAVKNVIAFDYWPDHPRKLTLIYFTGVTHVIEEERRSFEDRPFLSASVCDAVLDEFPT